MLIFSQIWSWLSGSVAKFIGIAIAVLAGLAIVRKSGADAVTMKDQAQTLKDIGIKNEVETDVNNASDADLDKRLSKFNRD